MRGMEQMKLVRDKIPDIILANGKIPEYEFIKDDSLYHELLNQKLEEEVKEYLESGSIEEICDILEVLYAILKAKNLDISYIDAKRKEKNQSNGAFEKRILLRDIRSK